MTKFLQNRPPSSKEPNLIERLLERLRNPSRKVTIIGISGIILGVGGYWGLQVLVKKKLPPFLEDVIGNFIDRPIDLGEVQNFSLIGIEFGKTEIPATATDPDYVAVEEVKVGFNLLPIIFRRTLPLDVTLVQPEVYAEQEANGEWLNLDFLQSEEESKDLPIYLDVNIDVEEGDIVAVPYNKSSIQIDIDGSGRYNSAHNTHIEYDLETAIAKAKATIRGKTVVETGKTDTKLLIKDLALADVATLLPNPPLNLNSGKLNANLDIQIPSFAEINATDIEGKLSLQELSGEAQDLNAPIQARSQLEFGGKDVQVEQTQASIGDIVAQLSGTVNWQKGYNLAIDVLPFRLSSLTSILPTELPVDTAGEVKAQLQVIGDIQDPVIKGKINNTKTIRVAESQFKQIQANFIADLDKFLLNNLAITPLEGGKIIAEGTIVTNIKGSLESQVPLSLGQMLMAFNFNAQLPTEEMIAPYYQLPSTVAVGNLQATGKIRGKISSPQALIKWQIPQVETSSVTRVSGDGEILLVNQNLFLQDTEIEVGEGSINIEGNSDLEAQTWQTDITAKAIALNPFLSQLPLEGVKLDRQIRLENANVQLQGKLDELNPNKIQGVADAQLDVDGGDVALNTQLNQGNIQVLATTNDISVGKFIPNLPIPTTVQSARVDLTGKLQQLLAVTENPNLSSVNADLNANLTTADGTVKAAGKLTNNQWQTDIRAANLNTNYLLDTFAPNNQVPSLDNLNAQVNLTGNINPLLNNETNLPVSVNQFAVQTGNQSLNANGNIMVSNLITKPDVANADLDLNLKIDFDRLPINQLVSQVASNNQLIAESVKLAGNAEFQGKLQGKNLISAPTKPGNVVLTGDLRLEDWKFNDTIFEPVMSGQVIAKPGERISIDLQGTQDVIAANLQPCTDSRCRLPYLPTKLELREGEDTNQPIIAEGKKQGDVFSLDILNFPLNLLNLAPGKPLGIKGALDGDVTGEVDANLYTLAATGKVKVDHPVVGYIQADKFKANFNYNPNQNIAEVSTASLNLGESQYNFQGDLDLQSGKLKGKLNIPQAYIQDTLNAFRWFTIEDLTRLFRSPDYAKAVDVDPNSIITVNQSITQKLNLLREIENKIQAIADARKVGTIPTKLDVQGSYQGEVIVDGTIAAPKAYFKVEGNNWQWQTQPGFASIVPPLGLIKQETQLIALDKLLIQGNFQEEKVNLDTAKITIEDTVLSLNGQLSANQQNANYQVENLTIDTIDKFVNIPVDIAGVINTTGTITGTVSQPKLQGQINFTGGAFNGRVLPTQITGNYNYSDERIKFNTTAPESIQVAASLPYPIKPGRNDRFNADIQLTTEAFSLLDAFTQNNLIWLGGEGTANLQATGGLDLNRETILYDLDANGEVTFNNATVKNSYFQEPLIATGKVTLDNQILTVETLKGKFAGKDLSAKGSLPILSAVANLANPLTINMLPGAIDVKGLYQGEIEGDVVITSTALTPVIGGEVSLHNGQVFIPQHHSTAVSGTNLNLTNGSREKPPAVVIELENFQVNLEKFKLQQSPLYKFEMAGDLNLNGTLDNLANLQAEGGIRLTQGNVDLLTNNFTLVRSHENLIVFKPEAGILNPSVNVQMKTEISEFTKLGLDSQRQLSRGTNEIPDSISTAGNTDILTINLNIDGQAQEILPSLGQDSSDFCRFSSNNSSVAGEAGYSQTQLDRLAKCIELTFFNSASDRQLVNSPAVELTSIPARSQGEIVSLLGTNFISFAEELRNKNTEELLDLGVTQFVIAPIQRSLFNSFEEGVVRVGKRIGLDYLRVYPFVEGIYQINHDSSVRGTFNYINNLSGNNINNNEFKFEYQRRF